MKITKKETPCKAYGYYAMNMVMAMDIMYGFVRSMVLSSTSCKVLYIIEGVRVL